MARYPLLDVAVPALVVILAGALIPLAAFPVLRRIGKLSRADSGSIAAHYRSVSVVTFAVGSAYLARLGEAAEGYMTVFLVLLEFPAVVLGVMLARRGEHGTPWAKVLHEVFAGKSIVLLLGGLAIGWVAGPNAIAPLDRLFFDLLKELLAIFLLEMGFVASRRFGDLRRAGAFLLAFATLMPLAAAGLGLTTGLLLGLSVGALHCWPRCMQAPPTLRRLQQCASPCLRPTRRCR